MLLNFKDTDKYHNQSSNGFLGETGLSFFSNIASMYIVTGCAYMLDIRVYIFSMICEKIYYCLNVK